MLNNIDQFRKSYDELTFTDDFLFSKIMKDKDICKDVIETLLDIKVGKIVYLDSQKTIDEDFFSHGIRFDVYLKDSERIFDIEMQTHDTGDLPKRTRYYQAMMDIDSLKKGEKYSNLKESYILFICTFDPFENALPVYTFSNICEENPSRELNDKSKKIFYNASEFVKSRNKNVQAFLKYLATEKSSSELTDRLESAVETAKGNEPWRVNFMTFEMKLEEYKQMGIEKGLEEGEVRGREETALNLLKMNLPLDQIAKGTALSMERIQELQKSGKSD